MVDIGVRAANLIGDGFYGVDIKTGPDGPIVIEINDNPNLEHGVEDEADKAGLEPPDRMVREAAERLTQPHRGAQPKYICRTLSISGKLVRPLNEGPSNRPAQDRETVMRGNGDAQPART